MCRINLCYTFAQQSHNNTMTQENNKTLHEQLNAPGRKGAISKVAEMSGVHRNTVRRILQGFPSRGGNAAVVVENAKEVLREIIAMEMQVKEALSHKIELQQKRIDRMRSQHAA